MNVKKFLPLIVAAGLGLIALVIAHSGFGHDSGKAKDQTVRIIVAKDSVAPGQALTTDNLTEQAIAGTAVPEMAHTTMNDLLGRVTIAPMVPGQPVLDAFLAAPGALGGLPALVPPGMRAVTIDVNETTGVAGLIAPGAHVDIVTVLNQGEHERTIARTIASYVPVVAVGQRLAANRPDGDTSMARTVTLICKPREAELIKLAYTSSSPSLVLRGNGDVGPADAQGVAYTDLLGKPMEGPKEKPVVVEGPAPTTQATQVAMAQPAPSHVRHIKMYLGDKVEEVSFDMPDKDNAGNSIDDYTDINTETIPK
jgi:pilus assembly protein CpaB